MTKITGENPQKIKQIIDKYNQDEASQINKRGRNSKVNRSRESSCTCSREGSIVEKRQIITERVVKDQDKVDQFFDDKKKELEEINGSATKDEQEDKTENKDSKPKKSAANESKDAITERIVHTVNMMKEVLKGNLGLRETI